MTCPECGEKTKVLESKDNEDFVERRRECYSCGYRFNTIEVDKDLYERVVNRNYKRVKGERKCRFG